MCACTVIYEAGCLASSFTNSPGRLHQHEMTRVSMPRLWQPVPAVPRTCRGAQSQVSLGRAYQLPCYMMGCVQLLS